ncbi:MAG: hypothetical protein AAF601_15915 [Pseudomonadota bacterium]
MNDRASLIYKIICLIFFGPIFAVLALIGLTMVLQWAAECQSVRDTLECGALFGLINLDGQMLSFVGAGFALAYTLIWAACGLALLLLTACLFLIFG